MSIPFGKLRRLPASRLAAIEDRALARHLAQEVAAFSPAGRRAFERAGLDPRGFSGRADLARLEVSTAADLAAADRDPDRRADWRMTPSAEAIRRHWPRGRRLALALGGPRAAGLLRHAYTSVLEVRERTGGETVAWAWTPLDVAAAAESGARALALLGLDRPGERALAVTPLPEVARLALEHGAVQCGAPVLFASRDEALAVAERHRPSAWIAGAADLEALAEGSRKGTLPGAGLWVAVEPAPPDALTRLRRAAGEESALARLLPLAAARTLLVAGGAGADEADGFVWYPDLGSAEITDTRGSPVEPGHAGQLLWTATTGHGTVALRFATGLCARSREPQPREGLPRLFLEPPADPCPPSPTAPDALSSG